VFAPVAAADGIAKSNADVAERRSDVVVVFIVH
jgi:hypothetical protein